jgi:hypothetical protein
MRKSHFKSIIQPLRDVRNHRLYRIRNCSKLYAVCFPNKKAPSSIEAALPAAMRWLCLAQDITNCGGVSAGFSFRNGWEAAYPETTGYIVETFYDYATYSGNDDYRRRARQMAEWLLSIQTPFGAFQGGPVDADGRPVVFNTGMILFGLVRAYQEEGDERFLTAAIKAGDWLSQVQDSDGAWRKYTYVGRVHTYKTRVAWALLRLWQHTNDHKYFGSATKNLDWALSRQSENGFFADMSFVSEPPFLHTIAYTIRGILESGAILDSERYVNSALKAANPLFRFYELNKKLPGQFDNSWLPVGNYSCLTGCAQISIVWHKLGQMFGDTHYCNAATKMNDFLIKAQFISPTYPDINGAIMGSSPIWGDYMSYYFPNWAAKFYAEALMREKT